MGIHCRYPANYKGYYIQSTMSPLVTSLMLLMVMVINTKGAPNPDTDNYSYSYEEDPVPCYPNCPPSKGQRFKRSAAPNPDTDNYEYVYEDPVPCAPNCPNGQRFKRYNSDDLDLDFGQGGERGTAKDTKPRPGMWTRPNGQRLSGNERANRYSFDDMDMDMGSADGTFDDNDWRDGRKQKKEECEEEKKQNSLIGFNTIFFFNNDFI